MESSHTFCSTLHVHVEIKTKLEGLLGSAFMPRVPAETQFAQFHQAASAEKEEGDEKRSICDYPALCALSLHKNRAFPQSLFFTKQMAYFQIVFQCNFRITKTTVAFQGKNCQLSIVLQLF